MASKLITKAEAKAKGLKEYDGEECQKCHTTKRYVNSGKCIECHTARNAARKRGKAKIGPAKSRAVVPSDNGAVVKLYDGAGQRPGTLNKIAAGIQRHLERAKTGLEGAVRHIEIVCGKLEEARPLCTEIGFSAFCREVGIGRSRAYELLAIADGRKTIEEVRAEGRERSKRFYAKRRPLETDKPTAEITKPEPPIIEAEIIEETPPPKATPSREELSGAQSLRAAIHHVRLASRYSPEVLAAALLAIRKSSTEAAPPTSDELESTADFLMKVAGAMRRLKAA